MSSPQALSQKQLADAILDMVRHPGCKGKIWTPEELASALDDGPPNDRDWAPVTACEVWRVAGLLHGQMVAQNLRERTISYKGSTT